MKTLLFATIVIFSNLVHAQGPCINDVKKLCPNIEKNKKNIVKCILDNEAKLSPACKERAKIIMSTKDMVDRVTGWLDDVSEMRAEQLLQLGDSIRAELGAQKAEQYMQAVRPALEEIYSGLEKTRGSLQSALAVVSGQEGAEMMGGGAPGAMPGAPGADLGASGEMPGAPGGEEPPEETAPPMGREVRETAEYSRKLAQLLASKKK